MRTAERARTAQIRKRYRVRIDAARCKGCELCVNACPREALGMCAAFNARGAHFAEVLIPDNCTGCLRCALICPDIAIEIDEETE